MLSLRGSGLWLTCSQSGHVAALEIWKRGAPIGLNAVFHLITPRYPGCHWVVELSPKHWIKDHSLRPRGSVYKVDAPRQQPPIPDLRDVALYRTNSSIAVALSRRLNLQPARAKFLQICTKRFQSPSRDTSSRACRSRSSERVVGLRDDISLSRPMRTERDTGP